MRRGLEGPYLGGAAPFGRRRGGRAPRSRSPRRRRSRRREAGQRRLPAVAFERRRARAHGWAHGRPRPLQGRRVCSTRPQRPRAPSAGRGLLRERLSWVAPGVPRLGVRHRPPGCGDPGVTRPRRWAAPWPRPARGWRRPAGPAPPAPGGGAAAEATRPPSDWPCCSSAPCVRHALRRPARARAVRAPPPPSRAGPPPRPWALLLRANRGDRVVTGLGEASGRARTSSCQPSTGAKWGARRPSIDRT